MERQDYPAMLPTIQPGQAVDILNDRVRQVGRLNVAIADWLLARRQLEEQYSAGLRRLSQRPVDANDLGIFSVPWTTMTGSADTMADAHASFAARIEAEIEQPLREFASKNREMNSVSTSQGNLAALAKDVEKAQQKADKAKGRSDRAEGGRITNAGSDLDAAQSQWESQAPFVFESLQALDEKRLDNLRELLTQFQTMETDHLEKSRVTAEQCLNVLLNVQTEDEIKTFVLKATSASPPVRRAHRNSVAMPTRTTSSTAGNTLSPSTTGAEDDRRSQVSESVPEGEEKRKGGGLGRLKRLGTVMSRRRESRIPPLPSTAESPERKQKPSPFNNLGRLGRSKENAPTLEPPQQATTSGRPSSPLRLGSEIFQAQSERDGDPSGGLTEGLQPSNAARFSFAPSALTNGGHQDDVADLEPPKPIQSEPQTSAESPKDREGFSVPPADLDPISKAQQEAAMALEGIAPPPQFNVNIRDKPIQEMSANNEASFATAANRLQAPPPATRRSNTVRGRRADRQSAFIPSTYIPTEQQISESAFAPPPQPPAPRESSEPVATNPVSPPIPPAASITGNTTVQSPGSILGSSTITAPAFQTFAPDMRTTTSGDQGRADTQSIRSSSTTGSQGGIKHPEFQESGLNASIIETVGARFENGKLTSSSLIGEIGLAYNPTNLSSIGTEVIRLENYSNLEKVAPNPAFITQSPDKQGEYTVNLASIARTQVAFKYQIRPESVTSRAPLLLTPAFKIEPSQSSIIINYSLNPSFALGQKQSIKLSNVMLALTLEGARATSCQSKPVGTFSREKNMIFWQLNDIILTPGSAPEKLLARFATESEATGGSMEAKWEINGDNALGVGSDLGVTMQGRSLGAGDGADPFADESAGGAWKSVNCTKKLTSGLYVAK